MGEDGTTLGSTNRCAGREFRFIAQIKRLPDKGSQIFPQLSKRTGLETPKWRRKVASISFIFRANFLGSDEGFGNASHSNRRTKLTFSLTTAACPPLELATKGQHGSRK
jgi:hypothetical protein